MISFLVIFGCFVVSSFGQKAITCPENEQVNPCSESVCGEQKCSDIGKETICVAVRPCTRGCSCISGHLRADNGTCIPRHQCPTLTCPENEVVNHCANALCREEICSDIGKSILCAHVRWCIPACSCTYGSLRADNGTCIPREQCPEFLLAPPPH